MNRKNTWPGVMVALLFTLAFAIVLQLPSYAQGRSSTEFVVMDSAGRTIGPVVGVYGEDLHLVVAEVLYKGKWLTVFVQRNGFLNDEGLFFSSYDCTGQAYFYPTDTSPFPVTSVSPKDNYLYYEAGPPQQVSLNSSAGLDQYGFHCYQNSYGQQTAVPMAPSINMSAFTPPFSVLRRPY